MENDDPTRLLPDDALAAVLARLPPRGLAASRCVCRAWRAVVDTRRLLRTDLLPLSLAGIFLTVSSEAFPPFLSRPSVAPAIRDNLERFGTDDLGFGQLQEHCNGLLLFPEHVVNPATGRWACLPPPPPSPMERFHHRSYLMFDPATSPYYEVLLLPQLPHHLELDRAMEEAEWPPSPCTMRVFSSRAGRWEERSFNREGRAMGTVADMSYLFYDHSNRCGVYWRGVLYVQCHQNNFVMRINLSTSNYQMIEPPPNSEFRFNELHLGKSDKGVYYAITDIRRLLVWFLDESNGQMEWVLKCDRELMTSRKARPHYDEEPWLLQCFGDDNFNYSPYVDDYHYEDENVQVPEDILKQMRQYHYDEDEDVHVPEDIVALMSHGSQNDPNSECVGGYNAYGNNMEVHEKIFEGGSNNEYVDSWYGGGCFEIFGFHPFKEVVFLNDSGKNGVAYHLSTSKIEDLGRLSVDYPLKRIASSFVYTPCWMGDILENSY